MPSGVVAWIRFDEARIRIKQVPVWDIHAIFSNTLTWGTVSARALAAIYMSRSVMRVAPQAKAARPTPGNMYALFPLKICNETCRAKSLKLSLAAGTSWGSLLIYWT